MKTNVPLEKQIEVYMEEHVDEYISEDPEGTEFVDTDKLAMCIFKWAFKEGMDLGHDIGVIEAVKNFNELIPKKEDENGKV